MSTISIRRPHNLNQKQAVEIAKQVAADLVRQYGITSSWVGSDSVKVQGAGLTGKLHLAPKVFELDIKLGFMLAMFCDDIRNGIEAKLDDLLAG
jgi:putative polyhydroxyalkanoate system protein